MKTSFLVLKLKSTGYQVKVKPLVTGKDQMKGKVISVYTSDGNCAGYVCTKLFGTLSTDTWVTTSGKSHYSPCDINDLVEALTTYALTPLDKREDEPKFRVIMLPEDDDDWEIFLNLDKSDNHIFIDDSINGIPDNQTIFTKSEYDKLQQKYHDWLPKFDKNDPHFVEVQDDNNSESMAKLHDSELMYPDEEFTRNY